MSCATVDITLVSLGEKQRIIITESSFSGEHPWQFLLYTTQSVTLQRSTPSNATDQSCLQYCCLVRTYVQGEVREDIGTQFLSSTDAVCERVSGMPELTRRICPSKITVAACSSYCTLPTSCADISSPSQQLLHICRSKSRYKTRFRACTSCSVTTPSYWPVEIPSFVRSSTLHSRRVSKGQ